MFARIGTYDVPEDQGEAAKEAFRAALRQIRELPGFRDASLLLACDGGRAMTITFWDDRHAMSASRVAATRLRSEAARAVDGEVVTAVEYEVVPLE
jgi:heme-degrading monooxygenase HmoA